MDLIEEHRNISVATLQKSGVTWDDNDYNYPVRFEYRHRNGAWYQRKGLRPGLEAGGRPKVLSPTNGQPHLYNPTRIGPDADLLFFTEGEYDTLSVIDCGYTAVGSQGTNTFKAVWARLFSGATSIIAFDGDAAGKQAAAKLRKLLRNTGGDAYIMDVPETTDLNDLHVEGRLDAFIEEFLETNDIG